MLSINSCLQRTSLTSRCAESFGITGKKTEDNSLQVPSRSPDWIRGGKISLGQTLNVRSNRVLITNYPSPAKFFSKESSPPFVFWGKRMRHGLTGRREGLDYAQPAWRFCGFWSTGSRVSAHDSFTDISDDGVFGGFGRPCAGGVCPRIRAIGLVPGRIQILKLALPDRRQRLPELAQAREPASIRSRPVGCGQFAAG